MGRVVAPQPRIGLPEWRWDTFFIEIVRSVFDGTWNSANGRAINYWWGMRSGAEQINYSAGQNSGTMQLLRLVEKQIAKDDVQVFPSEDRKSTRLNSSHQPQSRMPSSA